MFKKKKSPVFSGKDHLTTQFRLRKEGQSILSVLVGETIDTRAIWGRVSEQEGYAALTAPTSDLQSLQKTISFWEASNVQLGSCPAVIVVLSEVSVEVIQGYLDFIGLSPHMIGVALSQISLRDLLKNDGLSSGHRTEILKGLIMVDSLAPVEKGPKQEVLYRSPHEEIIHKLLLAHPDFPHEFVVNQYRRGGSGVRYEVDFFSEELNIALEIDGSQHWNDPSQKQRDIARDTDLADNNIKTIRIKAESVLTDPTSVIKLITQRINEIQKNF